MLYKLVNYRSLSGALGNGAIQKGEGEMKPSGIVTPSLQNRFGNNQTHLLHLR